MNDFPFMARQIVKSGVLCQDPLSIVDVGASGGIHPVWEKIFGGSLKAIGFDPLIAECRRLNSSVKSDAISYHPYYIGSENQEVVAASGPSYASKTFIRTSAWKAIQLQKVNFAKEYYNQGDDLVYTDQKTSLDTYFLAFPQENIDFIKVDTDGYDYEVLDGATKILSEREILGVTVESQFHGASSSHSNTFRNIDRLLTDLGYSLFDLQVQRYSKDSLPATFAGSIPAETTTGQALWGEAVYFKDYILNPPLNMSVTKLLKLICLLDCFKLPDCSAELLNHFRETLEKHIDVDLCLNLLTKEMKSGFTYKKYIQKFEKEFQTFYSPSSFIKLRNLILKKIKKKWLHYWWN